MMKFNSIETYEKYKNDKKILKEIEKSKQAYQKRVEYYEREKKKYMEKQQLLIEGKMSRRLQKDESLINLRLEKKTRKLAWKKPLKKLEKKPSMAKIKKEIYRQVQLLARLTEVDSTWWGRCISCWKRVKRDEADGGHYIPRQHMETAFDLRNIHLQCKNCNGRLHGNLIPYRENLIKLYGENFVLELEARKNITREYNIPELKAILAHTNSLIEREKKKLI